MCRLGFISSKKETQVNQLIESATRHYGKMNPHGVGFSYVSGRKIVTIKSPQKASAYWNNATEREIETKAAIFHVRYASVGDVCKVNTHPMVNKKYVLVHNGTLENWREAKDSLKRQGYEFKSTTDSEVLLAAWTVYHENFLEFLYSHGVRGWYTILILSKSGKIRAITNSGALVVFRRDNDVIAFSDSTFKNLKDKYKIKLNVLYTFKNGRMVSKQNIPGVWSQHDRPEKRSKYAYSSDYDEDEIRSWLKSYNSKR